MPVVIEKPEEKVQPKPTHDQTVEKGEPEKITVQIESNVTKLQSIKNETKKPKRPLTYLT